MNSFNKVFLTSFVFFTATTFYIAAQPQDTSIQSNEVHGIALKDRTAKLLDLKFRNTPVSIYRIHKSCNEIKKSRILLKSQQLPVHAQESAFVKEQLDLSLKLVVPFISDIQSYKDLILPLIYETTMNHSIKKSYLTQLLNGTDALDVFTDKNITTIETLDALLEEIHVFLLDLFASLSKETKDAYKKFIEHEKSKIPTKK